ncbi:hypothetical protein AKJ39_03110 [candidate division MSBL1 archaeon SCGC-AAA259J03]|nr:hypothetical protein AKJ39_03110 [candidate division MSBL1 archaeon SCGC-AAA259J03]
MLSVATANAPQAARRAPIRSDIKILITSAGNCILQVFGLFKDLNIVFIFLIFSNNLKVINDIQRLIGRLR